MHTQTRKMAYTALFSALIFVGAQVVRIPLPFGYFNFGDCFVLLAGLLLGGPYAMLAAAIGAGLTDVLSGYAIYAPATLLIKALMVVPVMMAAKLAEGRKHKTCLMALGAVLAEAIMVCGYFLYETVLYGLGGAAAALPGNILQGVIAAAAATAIVAALEHSGFVKRVKTA